MNMKWITRLGSLLLLFFVILLFFKLKPIWYPPLLLIMKAAVPFSMAAFISYLLYPVVEKLHQRGMSRSLSIILIYALFFGLLGAGLYKGIPVLIDEVESLMVTTPEVAQKYTVFIDFINEQTERWPVQLKQKIDEGIVFFEVKAESFLTKILASLTKLFDWVIVFAIIPLIAFYFLKDWATIKKTAWYITPARIRKQSIAFIRDLEESLGDYIRGQLLVCLIIGVASALLLWALDIKYALLLGIFIGATNVIPYFGPIIGAIPAAVIAAAAGTEQIIYVVIVVFALQFVEGNLLSPLIVGKSLHMHPLLIMLSLFLGGEVGGIAGLVLAVPILAFLKVSVMHGKVHFMKEMERKRMHQQLNE
ncbi:MAG: AI-2E family transporter [Bacillus sp. (in: firmicutes)]